MEIRGRNIMTVILFLLPVLLYGEIRVEVDNIYPSVGESFNLRVTMDRKQEYVLKGGDELEILGRSSSSSVSIVNGKRTSEYTDIYQMTAMREGIYSLQAAAGEEESNIVDIEAGGTGDGVQEEKSFFLRVSPEKAVYYYGEKIPYEESLIITENISDVGYVRYPEFDDISIVDVDPGMRIGSIQKKTRVGGREALEIVLYQGILEPTSSGGKTIGGSLVRVASGGGGFYQPKVYNIPGESREIEVKPLPAGAPEGFKNIVGNIEAHVALDRGSLSPGEAATMTVTLSGSGSLAALNRLTADNNRDFSIYENIVDEREWIEGERYLNEKTYRIAFVPRRSGEYRTPEISIPYFSPEEERYRSLVIEGRELVVEGEAVEEYQPVPIAGDRGSSGVEIRVVPEGTQGGEGNPLLLYILGITAVIQGGVILCLLRGKLGVRGESNPLKKLRRSRTDNEIYESYCEYMRGRYGFNPKAHSSEVLRDRELQDLNREIEAARFKKEALDRRKIHETLKRMK